MPEGVSETLLQLLPKLAGTRREMAFTRGFCMARLRGFRMVSLRENRLNISNASERDEHREEAESVEKEISSHADDGHGKAAERWPQDARHIELRRIERDGVGEVFSRHKLRHQRLIGGRIE